MGIKSKSKSHLNVGPFKKPSPESEVFLLASGEVVGLEEGEAGIDVAIGGGDVEEHCVERRIAEVAHFGVGGR